MHLRYNGTDGDFTVQNPHQASGLYFPLLNNDGMMCSVTPDLAGDAKTAYDSYVLAPVTRACLTDMRQSRAFWCVPDSGDPWCATGRGVWQRAGERSGRGDTVAMEGGLLWQCVRRANPAFGLSSDILSFVPVKGTIELMVVTLRNTGAAPLTFTPIVAIPLYGRSGDNFRDHRHITGLLNRIQAEDYGVTLSPALRYTHRGVYPCQTRYGVYAAMEERGKPVAFCLTQDEFAGEGGHQEAPSALFASDAPWYSAGAEAAGAEAMGGIRFAAQTLAPGAELRFVIQITQGKPDERYYSVSAVLEAWQENRRHWNSAVNWNARNAEADGDFHRWMRWVSAQPIMRGVLGSSFLPYHDYGRGGNNWRDLWLDMLNPTLENPEDMRQKIVACMCGVRIDGTNANYVGTRPGDFFSDFQRPKRFWMDHGIWPMRVIYLYISQTGDASILLENVGYFSDDLILRGDEYRADWKFGMDTRLRRRSGTPYEGTVLEHLIVQHFCAFFDVGEHNHIRLRSGDWNDGMDMARERGESVAFSAAYAESFRLLSACLEILENSGQGARVMLAGELHILLAIPQSLYDSVEKKNALLRRYCQDVAEGVGDSQVPVDTAVLRDITGKMQKWLQKNIRSNEWITAPDGTGWYNGYYDNRGQALEGVRPDGGANMTLTGQIFTILSETATDMQIESILKAVDTHLYDPARGGYAINTDFGGPRPQMGRAFSYAYGHKENGSVFTQIAVMFAYALYRRGYARQAWKVISALYAGASDVTHSRMYPGLPEYFDPQGRGVYTYLTGGGALLKHTVQTQMFGVGGRGGDLLCQPKLLAEQFDQQGEAACAIPFAGAALLVRYENPEGLDYSEYRVDSARLNGKLYTGSGGMVQIPRADILALASGETHECAVKLVPLRR